MSNSQFNRKQSKDKLNFRNQVYMIVSKLYPKEDFQLPDNDPDVIIAREVQVGLQNLEAKFLKSDQKEPTLEALTKEHFSFVFDSVEPKILSFEDVLPQLRPQLMPQEYAQRAPIVSIPFGKTLCVGIVVDDEKGYLYLNQEDISQWQKSPEALLDTAIENLDKASSKLVMHTSKNEQAKFISIGAQDGFDAARILSPKLHDFISEQIGSPFHFGVPNRDFLICWSAASEKFMEFAKTKIRKVFEEQPYPLSPNTFVIDSKGEVIENENLA